MDVSPDQLSKAILFLIAFVLSITVHEFGHAWVADKLGDGLPRSQGRVSLSPVTHVDPIGTLLMPFLMVFASIPMLGWGRPVRTNPLAYTRRISRATGHMLVATAGPAMNFLMALVVTIVVVVGLRTQVISLDLASALVSYLVQLNISLMLFNLLPIPPLDGGAVLAWALPRSLQFVVDFLNRWGTFILLAILISPLIKIVYVPMRFVSEAWLGLLSRMASL